MRDLLQDYERLAATGPVGRAVVTQVWGSAPRREGATMLATPDRRMAGSVSGGCVEGAVCEAIVEAIAQGRPRLLRFTVSDERAWEVGLACGGAIHVFAEPEVRAEVLATARATDDAVVATVIEGPAPLGRPDPALDAALAEPRRAALAERRCRTVRVPGPDGDRVVFLEVMERQPTLLLVGAAHIAEALARMAGSLGYRVVVADAREPLLTRERFPEADQLLCAWPDEVFRTVGVDDRTFVCVLTHDPKFDDPAIELALASRAAYVGAIGSRKTQADRRERLLERGFTREQVARIHGPIGLDLGGRHPAEIALAILAQVTAVRYGRDAGTGAGAGEGK